MPLFDAKGWVRDFEKSLHIQWEVYANGLAPNLAPDAPKGGAFGEAGGLGGAVGAAEADGLAHGLGFGVAAAAQVHELDESQTQYDDPD